MSTQSHNLHAPADHLDDPMITLSYRKKDDPNAKWEELSVSPNQLMNPPYSQTAMFDELADRKEDSFLYMVNAIGALVALVDIEFSEGENDRLAYYLVDAIALLSGKYGPNAQQMSQQVLEAVFTRLTEIRISQATEKEEGDSDA